MRCGNIVSQAGPEPYKCVISPSAIFWVHFVVECPARDCRTPSPWFSCPLLGEKEHTSHYLYLLRALGVLLSASQPSAAMQKQENIYPGCLFSPSVLSDWALPFDKKCTTCKISPVLFHNWCDLFYQ